MDTKNVKAVRYLNRDEIREAGSSAGAYAFVVSSQGEPCGIEFICPCGCGHECYVNITPGHPSPSWKWNGDKDKPTLKPSIFNTGLPCRWHGYLTDGEFRQC
jgi:hypothetical protein